MKSVKYFNVFNAMNTLRWIYIVFLALTPKQNSTSLFSLNVLAEAYSSVSLDSSAKLRSYPGFLTPFWRNLYLHPKFSGCAVNRRIQAKNPSATHHSLLERTTKQISSLCYGLSGAMSRDLHLLCARYDVGLNEATHCLSKKEEGEPIDTGIAVGSNSSTARNMEQENQHHNGSNSELYEDMGGIKSLLDRVKSPADLKNFSLEQLEELVRELRLEIINTVSSTGGHLSASLGVVELTVALHYIFDTPNDKVVWDVSHQAYPHKILTGRREMMPTLRRRNGLSGFCKREESVHDCFGAGHSSTSLSAAQGFAVAMKAQGQGSNLCIAVIGDGGITGGMAYEAMNYIGHLKSKVLVILNDNEQVSLPTGTNSAGGTGPAGALASHTARLLTSRGFQNFRKVAKCFTQLLPSVLRETAAKIDEFSRGIITGGTLFEELGFYYVGPVDGHDLESLVSILRNIKDSGAERPILLHVKTKKGYGYAPAMQAADKMHGVVKFDVDTGKQHKKSENPALTTVFAKALCDIGKNDENVVAVTAAMPGGTGVQHFGKLFPNRTFDVGIAEQHAVTFSGGLAAGGLTPFCCIYSTFLQRGYDQVIHDVVLQQLPVRFIVDRAGLVGADGATHQGAYDLAYLGTLPSIVIMAPSNEIDLMNMVQTAYEIDDMPSVVRYSRGNGYGLEFLNENFGYNLKEMPQHGEALKIGTGRIVRRCRENANRKVAVLSLGTRLAASVSAARELEAQFDDVGVTVADARFMRPLDIELIRDLSKTHKYLITIEEGSIGGFGDHVLHFMALDGLLDDGKIEVRPLVLPDKFIEQGSQDEQYDEAGLSTPHIVANIRRLLKKDLA